MPPPATLARRLLLGLLTLAASVLLCFGLGQLTPGDAFTALELDPSISPTALAHLRSLYLPQHTLPQRLWAWTTGLVHGDLGYSLQFHRPVLSLLRERAPASLELILLGLGLAWGIGLLLALMPAWLAESARWKLQRRLHLALHAVASLLTALPLGVLAVVALTLAPVDWLPDGNHNSPWLPAAVLALAFLPTVYFQAAHALERIARRPFLMQGRAAGIAPWRLVLRHTLPNTTDVLVPVASLTVSQALVELVILEPLMGWPGLGQLSIQAAQARDLPVLSALVLLSSLLVILGNWSSELAQIGLNPQLRRRGQFLSAPEIEA